MENYLYLLSAEFISLSIFSLKSPLIVSYTSNVFVPISEGAQSIGLKSQFPYLASKQKNAVSKKKENLCQSSLNSSSSSGFPPENKTFVISLIACLSLFSNSKGNRFKPFIYKATCQTCRRFYLFPNLLACCFFTFVIF